MDDTATATPSIAAASVQPTARATGIVTSVLIAITVSHLLNDMMQSVVVAAYPLLKDAFQLSFTQIGLITLVYAMTASLLQPVVGLYTDRHPLPYSLSVGMGSTLVGLVLLATASNLTGLLVAAALIGIGSSVFHPEASRVARMVSGGRHGLAQSVFQVGGNLGSAIGPLGAALIILPRGQGALGWFSLAALAGMGLLAYVGRWYAQHLREALARARGTTNPVAISRAGVAVPLTVLGLLIFSKYFYLASLTNYYTFYLIDRFGVSVHAAQMHLFVFLVAVAVGTILGGPVGDRFGRRRVIWVSILGVAPFSLLMPHVGLLWTGVLSVVIGLVLASAFSAILVYAQELLPGRVGMVSGLFFGLAFGMAGIGAAVLGKLADRTSITFVYQACAFLPLLGGLTIFLPDLEHRGQAASA
jgi:MFS transporter, FSR family, fosmidomycin resistance protein